MNIKDMVTFEVKPRYAKLVKPDPEKYCAYCGKRMHRVRFESGRVEDLSAFRRRRYCCRKCMAKGFENKEHKGASWFSEHKYARKIVGRCACFKCGSEKNVDIHHIDFDWHNNEPSNLIPLCLSCHLKVHRERKVA